MIQVTASIDDASRFDLRLAKLFMRYDVPVTVYFPVTTSNLYQTKGYDAAPQKTKTWLIENCELGSHTVTHPLLTRIPIEAAKDEIFDSKQMLESQYDKPISKFCYPRGYANDEIRQLVREAGYTYARNTLVGELHKSIDPIWTSTAVHAGCNRKEYNGRKWLEYAKDLWTEALELEKTESPVFEIFAHGWEIEKNNQWSNVKKLLEFIRNGKC